MLNTFTFTWSSEAHLSAPVLAAAGPDICTTRGLTLEAVSDYSGMGQGSRRSTSCLLSTGTAQEQ